MQWWKAHPGLLKNPKRTRFAKALGVKIRGMEAMGYLFAWFSFVCDHAPLDGRVEKFDAEEIAHYCEWPKEGDIFLDALISSGFIEKGENGSLLAHDWMRENGQSIKDFQRKRDERFKKRVHGQSEDSPQTVLDLSVPTNVTNVTNGTIPPNPIVPSAPEVIPEPPPPPPPTPESKNHQPVDLVKKDRPAKAFTDHFWVLYEKVHGDKPNAPVWVWKKADVLAAAIDPDDLIARVENYFADPFLSSHSFEKFVSSPDSWKVRRVKFGEQKNARLQGSDARVGGSVGAGKFTGSASNTGGGDPLSHLSNTNS